MASARRRCMFLPYVLAAHHAARKIHDSLPLDKMALFQAPKGWWPLLTGNPVSHKSLPDHQAMHRMLAVLPDSTIRVNHDTLMPDAAHARVARDQPHDSGDHQSPRNRVTLLVLPQKTLAC